MRLKPIGFSFAAVTALCLIAAPARAQGKGHDKDRGAVVDHHTAAAQAHDADRDSDHDGERGASVDRRSHVPPGLAKKGGLPPGQAKKLYGTDQGMSTLRDVLAQRGYTIVRTGSSGDTRSLYYRYRNGTLHRAVIAPGTNQLSFSNVPASILQQVLSRLY